MTRFLTLFLTLFFIMISIGCFEPERKNEPKYNTPIVQEDGKFVSPKQQRVFK
jgi:cbb3-type cytochrome oxidase subunit 3